MFENRNNHKRCPVTTYLAYKHQRPPEMMDDSYPFYLAINTEVPKAGKRWFKASPLGVNSLRSMVKNMLVAFQVQSDKKLVNHSTRKHLVQKFVDSNIPPNEIVQITGHKNINSLNNYSAISGKRQQQISAVLSGGKELSTCTSAMIQSLPILTVDEITAMATIQPSISAGTLPFFCQSQVGKVNIFTTSNQNSGEIEQKQFKRQRIIISDSDKSQ